MIGALVAGITGSGGASLSSYESIATATGTGSSGTITFSSIPSTFKHLEIRAITRNSNTGTVHTIRFNADSGTNYVQHSLIGDGTSVTAAGTTGLTGINVGHIATSSMSANIIGAEITSILDYGSTSKNKTVRNLSGVDDNSGTTTSTLGIRSGLWLNTAAITQIDLIASGSGNWTTATTFALYGIKEA